MGNLKNVFRSRKHLWNSVPASIRMLLGPPIALVPSPYLLGKRFRRSLRFVGDSQSWSSEQVREYQLDRLRAILSLAYARSRFYRQVFDSIGFYPGSSTTLNDVHQLPTIDKHTIIENMSDMCTEDPGGRHAEFVSTGGTSGVPLHFQINADRAAVEYSFLAASWKRVGYEPGMPMAVLRGRTVKRNRDGLRHEYDPILRHHHYSTFHMSEEDLACYLEHIATIGPCFLHVYPSSIAALAKFILKEHTAVPGNIRGIIAESETVYPEQRQMVEEAFGCRYFSSYGQTEKVVLAAECENSSDYHVWPTYSYFELLDDNGNSVTTPGQQGEIVGTGFINTVMPFIRYRTGDWATYVGDRCHACGREHTLICDVRGHRIQEVLITAAGSEISWTTLNLHDNTFVNVRQFQFCQETPGQAVLRVVPSEGFGEEDAGRIHRNLGRKLDGQLAFTIELTEAIPLSPRGKAIYVEQRIASVLHSRHQ